MVQVSQRVLAGNVVLGGGLSIEAVEVRVAVCLGSFDPIPHRHGGRGGKAWGVVLGAHSPGEASGPWVRWVGAVAGHRGDP